MSRYRLRFLLQEFDLSGPEVLLGRSGDCHITFEDPLVSRVHARIRFTPDPIVEDLGSRNGVRVNGARIDRPSALTDGDRIRLGTQELVFSVVRTRERNARPTGFMRNCLACSTPYPEGAPRCPHCGALVDHEEETTVSGLISDAGRHWTFQLLGEVIHRALEAGRAIEAERLMARAVSDLDAHLAGGERIDPSQLELISSCALRLAKLQESGQWARWVMTTHRSLRLMPSSALIDLFEDLELAMLPDVREELDAFVDQWRDGADGRQNPELGGLARLERLTR